MANAGQKKAANPLLLTSKDEFDIEQKVEAQIARAHYNSINLGGIANLLSGIFIIWILYGHVKTPILFGWYAVIILTSLIDTLWAIYFRKTIDKPEALKTWRIGFYFILGAISLTWGSMGILFITENLHYELY